MRVALAQLLACSEARTAGLTLEELLSLRLYTGPMYAHYNAVLRGHRAREYVTTIWMVASGIVKLAQNMKLPPDRRLYRGLSGGLLPERFVAPDAHGCRGGVERGFMSCTLRQSVAAQYVKARPSSHTPPGPPRCAASPLALQLRASVAVTLPRGGPIRSLAGRGATSRCCSRW